MIIIHVQTFTLCKGDAIIKVPNDKKIAVYGR